MGDRVFSDTLVAMLGSNHFSGSAMIAASRAVLDNKYSDEEYHNDFMTIFILIDEETGEIVLSGYGEYNLASGRNEIVNDDGEFRIGADLRGSFLSNYNIKEKEISCIESSYKDSFMDSVREFKRYFHIA